MLAVLMYHSVSTVAEGPLRPLAVPRELLRDQLAALAGEGFGLVGLTEAMRRRRKNPAERIVAVTFDDGFRDFLTDGMEVLREVGATATLYVPAGHIGRGAGWLGQRSTQFDRLLTWDEVRDVADAGIEIGNHSLIHEPLDVLDRSRLALHIRGSRDVLEQQLQTPVVTFAYPHGYHSRAVREAVARTGHGSACEVGHRLHTDGDDQLAIPRLQVTPDTSPTELVELVRSGGPRLVPLVKELAQPGWRMVRRAAKAGFGVRLT